MKREIRKVVTRLRHLEKVWPHGNLMLFGWSGSLMLIDVETLEIIGTFAISADGGDPDEEIREDGKHYLVM